MQTSFTTKILGFGTHAGIEVPDENIIELGAGKKPAVNVKIGDYSYPSTVGNMNGKHMISLSIAHRKASGLKAGDEVLVILTLETGYRSVPIPKDLETALIVKELSEKFDILAYSKRKEFCRQVNDAKTEETKVRRIEKIMNELSTLAK